MSTASIHPVITSYAKAPARTVTAGGVTYAYRELGPRGGVPVIFFVHLAATLDNWDPRTIDPIAKDHHVIAFDNRGVGASTGQVPNSVEAMADDAYTFIRALGFDKVDIFSFSLGGFVAQALVIKHPDLVRKLILTGTGPAGGKDIDKVAGITYRDMLRAALTRSDPKEFQGAGDGPRRRRRRATYNRNDGVRHLLAAYDLGKDKIYGHIKTTKNRTKFLEFCRYLRSLYPPEVRLAIVMDNFSPHLSTKKDQRVGNWTAANNVELAYVPTNASWLNRIEAQFQALRYFALDGTDHRSHDEQNSMIRRYIAWRNRHAKDEALRELVKRANVA